MLPASRACIAWILLLLAGCATVPSPRVEWVELRGFRIDVRRASGPQLADTLRNLEHQMEILEAAQLPAAVMSFFRGVPIIVDPELAGMNGEYRQIDGAWAVRARPGVWPADRAILLHELLHAYQREMLGIPTPPVGEAYAEALRGNVYPARYRDAYFLANGREFFAIIAEIYIAGPTFRPPFTCAAVKQAQPRFIAWLASHFGERECR